MINSDKLGIIRLNDEAEIGIAVGAILLGAVVTVTSYIFTKAVAARVVWGANVLMEEQFSKEA